MRRSLRKLDVRKLDTEKLDVGKLDIRKLDVSHKATEQRRQKSPKQSLLLAAAASVSGLVFLYATHHSIILCPVYAITGVPCPSCGMSRAWTHFLSGEIEEAFRYHPLFLLVLLVPLAFLLYRRKDGSVRLWVRRLGIFALVLLLAVWAWRMIVYFPQEAPMVWNEGAPLRILWRFLTAS